MQVREVMTPEVDLINPSTTLIEAARLMRDDDVGALPIGSNDRLVGMLTDRDLVIRGLAQGKDGQTATASEVMSEGILYCFDDQEVEDAATVMRDHQVRRLAVVNRDKRLVGMVSLGDISTKGPSQTAAQTLEEISKA